MTKLLSDLLEGIPSADLVRGDLSTAINSIKFDSRAVELGDLFVAIPGYNTDGHSFLFEAIEGGAVALFVQKDARSSWAHLPGDYPIIAVDNTRIALAILAANFYGNPSQELTVIGVTGTDGKTTTTHFMTKIFEEAGYKVGRLGTVDAYITGADQDALPSSDLTTPEAVQVQKLLRAIVDAG